MSLHLHRVATFSASILIGGLALPACGASEAPHSGSGDSAEGGAAIALLPPESKTTRYEAFDKPLFEAAVAELCDDCTVDYYNADQDE
ncbi:MAG: ABC transporter substrate-binding protein, partial [Nocardioides sp.]